MVQKKTQNKYLYLIAIVAVVAIVGITVITVSVINAKSINKNAPVTYSFDENTGGYAVTNLNCTQGAEPCRDGVSCCFKIQSV